MAANCRCTDSGSIVVQMPLRGGESGVPAIVPRTSARSLLIRYAAGLDPQVVMRPSGPRLSADQGRHTVLPAYAQFWYFDDLSRPMTCG